MPIEVRQRNNPDIETVKVNLDDEIIKMAVADGVKPTKAALDQQLTLSRKDYYVAAIRAYYRGRDDGYAEGVRMIGRPLRKMVLWALLSGILGGIGIATVAWQYLDRRADQLAVEGR